VIFCDGFVRFEQLIINYTQLIPPNAKQKLRTIDIRLYRWCWCMARLISRSSTLRIILVHPFLLPVTIWCEKPFLFCRSSCLHMRRRRSTSLGFNSYRTQYPCFWIISNTFKHFQTIVWSTANDSASSVSVWQKSSWSNEDSNSSSSNFFDAPERSLSSTSKFNYF